jgi:hypothetical protein
METTMNIVLAVLIILTKGEAREDLENVVMEMNERLVLTEEKMMQTEEELLELRTRNIHLEERIEIAENLPFFHGCAAHGDVITARSKIITYTDLIYSSTNIAGGGLDLTTGVFESPRSGSYQATWTLMATNDASDSGVAIYLRKNGDNIDGSYHHSYSSTADGYMQEKGNIF